MHQELKSKSKITPYSIKYTPVSMNVDDGRSEMVDLRPKGVMGVG